MHLAAKKFIPVRWLRITGWEGYDLETMCLSLEMRGTGFAKTELESVRDLALELDIEIHYINSIPSKGNLEIITDLRNVPIIIFEPYYPGTLLAKMLSQIKEFNLFPMQFGVKKIFSKDYGTYENHLKFHELDSESISTKVRQLI